MNDKNKPKNKLSPDAKLLLRLFFIILLLTAYATFEKPFLTFNLWYGGEVEAVESTWWGLKKEYYPVKLINGEWHIKWKNGDWDEIKLD